jgi:hypothetical protein
VIELVAPSERRDFGPGAIDELREHLRCVESQTVLSPLAGPEDVLIDPHSGLTRSGGYRYSESALRRLCGVLSPGLSALLFNLAGTDSTQRVGDAIEVFNRCALLCFDRVRQYVFLRHTGTGTIDGIVGGRQYHRWSNVELLRRVESLIADEVLPVQFAEASLEGRAFILRYGQPEPAFVLPEGDRTAEFFGGFQFCNSESGEYSTRAAATLVRGLCGGRAINRANEGYRAIHGRGFAQQLDRIFNNASKQLRPMGKLGPQMSRLRGVLLCAGGGEKAHLARCEALAQQLMGRWIQSNHARSIVLRTMSGDSAGSPPVDFRDAYELYSRRTAYDFFHAMTAEAKSLRFRYQEPIEQTAYDLLVGKFNLS